MNQASVWSVLNRSHAFHLSLRRSIFEVTLMKNDPPAGAVAQLGERSVRNAEVEGSIPFRSTLKWLCCSNLRQVPVHEVA